MSWKNLPLWDVVHYINRYKTNLHHHLTFKPFFILIWVLLCQRLGNVMLARCYFRPWAYEWVSQPGCDGSLVAGHHVLLSLARNRYWCLCWWHISRLWTTALGTCVEGTFYETSREGSSCPLDRTQFYKELFTYMSPIGRKRLSLHRKKKLKLIFCDAYQSENHEK